MQIALVDDSPADLTYFHRAVTRLNNDNVLALDSLAHNLQRISDHQTELLILDDRLGPLTAAEASLQTVTTLFPDLPVLVMSGDLPPSRRTELIRRGAFDCIEKDRMNAETIALIVAMAASRKSILKGRQTQQPASQLAIV